MRVARLSACTLVAFLLLGLGHAPVLPVAGAAEAPLVSWEASLDSFPELGGNGYDVMRDVVPTADGGAVAAGYATPPGSYSPGGKPQQAFLVRLDALGSEVWRRYLGELTGDDYEAVRVRRTVDGGFVAACTTFAPYGIGSPGIYYNISFVAKLDGAGTELWRYRFDPLSLDEIGDVDMLPDGSIVVAGRVWHPGGSTSTALAKLSPAGSLLWIRNGPPEYIQNIGRVAATPDGGFCATSAAGLAQTLSRYDPDGALLWSVGVEGLDSESLLNEKNVHGIVVEGDGRCIVAGATRYNYGATYGPYRPFLATFDAAGRQTATLVAPTLSTWVYAVERLPDGGIVAAEGLNGSNIGPTFIRYDRDGNELWRSPLGTTAVARYIHAIRVTGDGRLVATGAIWGAGNTIPLDGYVMMTDAMAADRGPGRGKTRAQLACEKACHDDHDAWVGLCLANHDPREITPSARGQCIEAGAERLQRCMKGCR